MKALKAGKNLQIYLKFGETNIFNWEPIDLQNVTLMGWDDLELHQQHGETLSQLTQEYDKETGPRTTQRILGSRTAKNRKYD